MTGMPLRRSEAAAALIREWRGSGWVYLCQWSDSWRAAHFVGGHREGGESFRECAVREALEELPVRPNDLWVPDEPLAHLEYVALSWSAGVPTAYAISVFRVSLATAARPGVDARPENLWVARAEARAGRAADGTRVSPTVDLILTMLGL